MARGTTGTPKKEPRERFLDALSQSGNVSAACKASGLSRRTVYNWRDEDEGFREAWQDAVDAAVDDLEREAWRRATSGVRRSDTLLIFLLKANRPEKYRERVPPVDAVELDKLIDEALERQSARHQAPGPGTPPAEEP